MDEDGGDSNLRQRGQAEANGTASDTGGKAAPSPPPTADSPEKIQERLDKEKRKNSGACMRFLRSPLFKVLTFLLIAVTPVFGVLFALPRILDLRECTDFACRAKHWFLAIWLASQFMFNFAMTQWTHAGTTKTVQPNSEEEGQFEMDLGPASSATPKAEADEDTGRAQHVVKVLYAPNYCDLCKHWKPPRAHHCTFCRRCVLRMDHHCPFTGNCIGLLNHGHFLLFFLFAAVGLVYSLIMCVSVLRLRSSWSLWWRPCLGGLVHCIYSAIITGITVAGFEITVQIVISIIALVAVLMMGIPAYCLVAQGITIIESHFPMKEYVQIKPSIYCPLGPGFYKHSWSVHFKELLGRNWWLRLLLPIKGDIDLSPGISPRPSPLGCKALRGRIDQVDREGVKHEVASCRDLGINPGPKAEKPREDA